MEKLVSKISEIDRSGEYHERHIYTTISLFNICTDDFWFPKVISFVQMAFGYPICR